MIYKPSKFNFIHKCENGELRLYNSLEGSKSLSIIPLERTEDTVALLENGAVSLNGGYEAFLIDHGFLVPKERDEDSRRKLRMMEETTDSTLELIILPTEQCNFRCKYCYETFEKGKMDTAVRGALVKYVRKNIHRFTSLHVNWFGGEPLVAIDVISYLSEEFIKICKTARKPYTASMTTNGYNLTLETYNKLAEYHVSNYQITLDGLEKEHDSQRVLANGGGTFQTIVQNLLEIKNNTRPFNTFITIRTNYTKKIIANLENFVRFLSENFGNDPRFSIYVQMASDWGGEQVKDFVGEIVKKGEYQNILKIIQRQKKPLQYGIHNAFLNAESRICYAARKNSVVIGTDGIIYKCTNDFTNEQNKVGLLTYSGEILFNENHYLWLSGIREITEKCKTCFFSGCCLSMCCPAAGVKGLDSDSCPFEKDNIGLLLELFEKELFNVHKEA
jgi:uncharacterized protein